VVALALLLVGSGCNNSGLVEVSGRLTYHGKPVPSTRVTFQPDDGSRRSTGVTDDDGNFRLRFSSQQTGAKLGPHTVTLKYDPSTDEELGRIPRKVSTELQAIIANKYGDAKTSKLHFEITQSGQFVPITLE
jgi:hypothetical protein